METTGPKVNNDIYNDLGLRWYNAQDDPIALLRAENRLRNPWLAEIVSRELGQGAREILDVGCGGGFLSNYLAKEGHSVTGLDASEASLEIARQFDSTESVKYVQGDAYAIPFEKERFDVVCAMDFLEHVDEPEKVVAQCSRVLRPGGLFFFYTFNRNFVSWLFFVKGVEVVVRNCPRNLHVYRNLIKPSELQGYCTESGLEVKHLVGVRPRINGDFFSLLLRGVVPEGFSFCFARSLAVGYMGWARKPKIQ